MAKLFPEVTVEDEHEDLRRTWQQLLRYQGSQTTLVGRQERLILELALQIFLIRLPLPAVLVMGTILITIRTVIGYHLQFSVPLPLWLFETKHPSPLTFNIPHTLTTLLFLDPRWAPWRILQNKIVLFCLPYEIHQRHTNRATPHMPFLPFQHSKIYEALLTMTLQQSWDDCALTMNLHTLNLTRKHSTMRRPGQGETLSLITRTRRLCRSVINLSLLPHLNKFDGCITHEFSPDISSISWLSPTSAKNLSPLLACL